MKSVHAAWSQTLTLLLGVLINTQWGVKSGITLQPQERNERKPTTTIMRYLGYMACVEMRFQMIITKMLIKVNNLQKLLFPNLLDGTLGWERHTEEDNGWYVHFLKEFSRLKALVACSLFLLKIWQYRENKLHNKLQTNQFQNKKVQTN